MYKINEIFQTIQGEGYFTGTAVIFIRLQGCAVGCAWCDTKQSWQTEPKNQVNFSDIINKTQDSPLWAEADTALIIKFISDNFTANHVVITGGEPCNYDLLPLTKQLENNGYYCQIETSGTAFISATDNTWVTLSPKINMQGKLPVLTQALIRANEIKHPVARKADVEALEQLLKEVDLQNKIIALQPISQKIAATKLCIDTCIERNWRLSVQLHKYLHIA